MNRFSWSHDSCSDSVKLKNSHLDRKAVRIMISSQIDENQFPAGEFWIHYENAHACSRTQPYSNISSRQWSHMTILGRWRRVQPALGSFGETWIVGCRGRRFETGCANFGAGVFWFHCSVLVCYDIVFGFHICMKLKHFRKHPSPEPYPNGIGPSC